MKAKGTGNRRDLAQAALAALRRAARKAVAVGQLTGTPAYVLEDGRIIDLAKRVRKRHGTGTGDIQGSSR